MNEDPAGSSGGVLQQMQKAINSANKCNVRLMKTSKEAATKKKLTLLRTSNTIRSGCDWVNWNEKTHLQDHKRICKKST